MASRVYRVSRRDLWHARVRGWRGRLLRRDVWGPMMAGLLILLGTGWWYTDTTAFARRAVATTAVVSRVNAPVRIEHENTRPTLIVNGMLDYQVKGRSVHAVTRLATCDTGTCVTAAHNRQGRSVRIVYDPKKVTRVRVGTKVPTSLNPGMLLLAALGAIFIGAGLYTLVFDLGIRLGKPERRQG